MAKNMETEWVNQAIQDHQSQVRDWPKHEQVEFYHKFFHIFNEGFDLFKLQPLPLPAISVGPGRRDNYGSYMPGRNGFGLCHNINLNTRTIEERSLLEQLSTLAHEMVHQHQEIYGKPGKGWYHNIQFCREAAGIGIIAAKGRGHTLKITEPFISLVRKHGITDPIPEFAAEREVLQGGGGFVSTSKGGGSSTLRKWSCLKCDPPVNIWVGRKEVAVLCLGCGRQFQRSG